MGPGKSIKEYNVDELFKKFQLTASLNDVYLYHPTDYYFVGEKFIFDYVQQHCNKDKFANSIKIFLGIDKMHPTRINKDYFNKMSKKWPNCKYIQSKSSFKRNPPYDISLIRKFSSKNMKTLTNLRYNISRDGSYYIRSRTLSNALQILLGFEIKSISLLGFMDSRLYERNDYKHQEIYVKAAKQKSVGIKSPKDVPISDLTLSLEYQQQILRTISKVFSERGGNLCSICPKDLDFSGLDIVAL